MSGANDLNVSRETSEKLALYVELLKKWSPKINLIARSTISDIWQRHINDSLQMVKLLEPANGKYVDLGSGGGLPGLVMSITRSELAPGISNVVLIESDQRKSVFLRTVLRETDTIGDVIADRIEDAKPQNADVLSARALAPLPKLLGFAEQHLNKKGSACFLKGNNWQQEVRTAQETFSFRYESHKSRTQDGSVILKIGDISRV